MDTKNTNIVNILEKSKYKILNFKLDLFKLYDIIYKFCKNNSVIISNRNINISKYNNVEYKLSDINRDFEFILLSNNPYKIGVKLCNILYNEYSKYIIMNSYIKNKEIVISIDNNKIIKIYLLFLFLPDNSNQLNNIKIEKVNLYYKNQYNLYHTDNLFELSILSHLLYHPKYFLQYYKDLKNNDINNDINSDFYVFNSLLKTVLHKSNTIVIKKKINKLDEILLNKLREFLINSIFLENKNIELLLLDSYALDFLLLNKNKKSINVNLCNFDNILHIITYSKYIDLIKKIINNYINNLQNKELSLVIKINNIYLLNDFRIKRYNFQIINKITGKKYIIGYIFNSLDFEIIPTILKIQNIYIPHTFVLIRFLIINLFYMKLFDKSYNLDHYNNFLNKLNLNYQNLIYFDNLNFDKSLIEYIGIYIDERIEKFKFGNNIYRPWQYFLQNKSLLNIL